MNAAYERNNRDCAACKWLKIHPAAWLSNHPLVMDCPHRIEVGWPTEYARDCGHFRKCAECREEANRQVLKEAK